MKRVYKSLKPRVDIYMQNPEFWRGKLDRTTSQRDIDIIKEYLETSRAGKDIAAEHNMHYSNVGIIVHKALGKIFRMHMVSKINPPETKAVQPPLSVDLLTPNTNSLEEALRAFIRQEVKKYIDELTSTSSIKHPQKEYIVPEPKVKINRDIKYYLLNPVTDEGTDGYFLNDIQKAISPEYFKEFIAWHRGRQGGIVDGQYYVLKKDFEDFVDKKDK